MPTRRILADFAELEQEFIDRVHRVVWCNVATIDRQGRVRSRLLHPFWEGATGWIATYRHSFKAKHLDHNPYVSLAYVAEIAKPVYADCVATWDDDPATKQHVWGLFRDAPPPLGYDPVPIFKAADDPNFGILKLAPWRIEVADPAGESLIWRRLD